MANSKIISEFERLIAFIQNENENNTANKFRIKQLSNVLNILKKYPEKITLDNLGSLKEVGGIGKGSIDRIIEILSKK